MQDQCDFYLPRAYTFTDEIKSFQNSLNSAIKNKQLGCQHRK